MDNGTLRPLGATPQPAGPEPVRGIEDDKRSGLDISGEAAEAKQETSAGDIASMLGMAALEKGGGLDIISKAIQSSQDPAQVVGQFLGQLVMQSAEYTKGALGIDPAVYAEKDGFIDQTLAFIERKLGLPADFSDSVYDDVLEMVKAAAHDSKEPLDEGARPAPEGAMRPLDEGAPARRTMQGRPLK